MAAPVKLAKALKSGVKLASGKVLSAAEKDLISNRTALFKTMATAVKNPVANGYRDTLMRNIASNGTLKGGQAFKDAAWNVGHAFSKEGGGFMKNFGKQALIGAGVGAGVNGTLEWGQGGSFWEGAKSGAVTGAMWGAGYGAFKAGMGVPGSAKGTIGQAGARFSKQVTTMFRSADAAQMAAKHVINKK